MSANEEVIKRLQESRPPTTDSFTYLTIVEKSLSPEILPALQEILEDAELTNDIGWDMVEMLIPIRGSGGCLERIARLGNPREVILKVLEVMDKDTIREDDENEGSLNETEDQDNIEKAGGGDGVMDSEDNNRRFVTLCGMLEILHRRLQVKTLSRFLQTTLETVYAAYDPTSTEATAAVVDLIRSLSGRKRPALPTRQSSARLEGPFNGSNPTKSAPDPEAEGPDASNVSEPGRVSRLLQCFITLVLGSYVNSNNLEWASRLLEYTFPERVLLGRKTLLQTFKESPELQAKDALVGQLASIASDLGLSKVTSSQLKASLEVTDPVNPLSGDLDDPKSASLSTSGLVCLTAYWIFSSEIFGADNHIPDLYFFPDHHRLLKGVLGDDAEARINSQPGTVESVLVLAIWLGGQMRLHAAAKEEEEASYMQYHHLLTLISVFHSNIRVRNAATVIAGLILHANPDEDDRLTILEDLLENCMFSALQACAVTWLREEIIASRKKDSPSRFANSDCFETLQYTLFPDLTSLVDGDVTSMSEFWTQNKPFHLQVANFALFLFGGDSNKDLVPAGMTAAVEHRYVQPLQRAAEVLLGAADEGGVDRSQLEQEAKMELQILSDVLSRVPLQ